MNKLVSQRLLPLGRLLPEPVMEVISSRSKGNPLYAIEVAEALRDAGMFTIEGGECRVSESYVGDKAGLGPGRHDHMGLGQSIPSSLKSLLVRRIDRLLPKEVLVCKLASVLGQQFQTASLSFLATQEGMTTQELTQCLDALQRHKILGESLLAVG
jgi:predicted ATPase